MGSPEVHQLDKISKNPLHPDNLPNDVDVIVPTMTAVCFVCGNDLMNLWGRTVLQDLSSRKDQRRK